MENLKEGTFNYFYKNGDDIKYVNDTINTQHDTDGTGDTGENTYKQVNFIIM